MSGFLAQARALALAVMLVPGLLGAGSVTGAIVDSAGNPIPGVTLEINFDLEPTINTTPDANGSFTATFNCPDGQETFEYDITIRFPDGRIAEVRQGTANCGDTVTIEFDPLLPPRYRQGEINNCGPAAAAALIAWLRQLGFPGIGDDDTLAELEAALAEAMKTSDTTGTDWMDLARELRRILNLPPYAGRFTVRTPRGPYPLTTAGPLLGASPTTPYFALLKAEDGYGHYVLVYGARTTDGGGMEIDVMDTATGARSTITFAPNADEGGRLEATYNNGGTTRTVYIDALICVESNLPSTESSAVSSGETGALITYRFTVPESANPPRDWHLRVSDPDPTKYEVTVPTGYKWEIVTVGGAHHISVYPDPDADPPAEPLKDGDEVRVRVDNMRLPVTDRVINFTFSGSSSPTDQAARAESGITPIALALPDPLPPVEALFASFVAAPNPLGAQLILGLEPLGPLFGDPDFQIFDAHNGNLLVASPDPVLDLTDLLQPGINQRIVVNALDPRTGLPGADSDDVLWHMYLDAFVVWTPASGPALFPPLFGDCPTQTGDCPPDVQIQIEPLGLTGDVPIALWGVDGARPHPPVPPQLGVPEDRSHFLWTPGPVLPGQFRVQLTASGFDADGVDRREGFVPRLLYRTHNQWIDGTLPSAGRSVGTVEGLAPQLPVTLAITYVPDPGAGVEDWRQIEP